MRNKKYNKKRRRPKDDSVGLSVKVFNNNLEGALKVFKRKIKDSNLFVELREKQFYRKPSEIKRERKSKAILREKYKLLKENETTHFGNKK
jgi:small subunit ribosomal protein S21